MDNNEVRHNAAFGATPDEREVAYKKAGRSANLLQGVAVVFCLWAIVYPYPRGTAVWVCIGLPWLCMLTAALSKGLIRPLNFGGSNRSNHLTAAFFLPGLALLLCATANDNVLNPAHALSWSIVITVPYLILLGVTSNWYDRKITNFVVVAAFGVPYGYGTLVLTNELLALGNMERQRAIIVGYHETHGKDASGYFTVTPWGPYSAPNDVRVTWNRYHSMSLNQSICFDVHTGLFNLQWVDTDYCYFGEHWEEGQSRHNVPTFSAIPLSVKTIGTTVTAVPGTPHAWALAAGLSLGVQLHMDSLKLGGWDSSEVNIEGIKDGHLIPAFSIYSRGDLLSELNYLETVGYRAEFERLIAEPELPDQSDFQRFLSLLHLTDLTNGDKVQFAKIHATDLRSKSLLAFDLVRVINVTRWGYLAGYLDEQEAWQRIMPAARKLQHTYSSWQDLADNYVLGREFWGGDRAHQAEFTANVKKAMNGPDSPTAANDWNMDLH